MIWIKSNRGKEEGFYICESNHNFHLILVMQQCDSNHKLHLIRITRFMLVFAQFDLKHHIHVTQITEFLTFSCWPLSNLIRVIGSKWLKSWLFMTRITIITWLELQQNGSLPLCWYCSTILVHLTKINQCYWLESNDHFHLFLYLILIKKICDCCGRLVLELEFL